MSYELRKPRKGKTFAGFITLGALSLATVTGTAFASLSTFTSTEADSESVSSDLNPNFRFNYLHAEDNQLIEADITPQDTATTTVFTKKITNDSALPAHAVLTVDNFDSANVPDMLLDNVKVALKRSDYTLNIPARTLREFVNEGFFIDRVINPDSDFTYAITFTIPSVAANDYSEAYGSLEETFNTTVSLVQSIDGQSPLRDYALITENQTGRVGSTGAVIFLKKDGLANLMSPDDSSGESDSAPAV